MRREAIPNGIVMIRTKQISAANAYPIAIQRPARTNQMMFSTSRISARRQQVGDVCVVLRREALRDQRAVAGLGVAFHAEEGSRAVGG